MAQDCAVRAMTSKHRPARLSDGFLGLDSGEPFRCSVPGDHAEVCAKGDHGLSGAIIKNWLEHFRAKAPQILGR